MEPWESYSKNYRVLFPKKNCLNNSAVIQSVRLKAFNRGLFRGLCPLLLPLAGFVWIRRGVLMQSSCLCQEAAILLSPIIVVWSKTSNKQTKPSSEAWHSVLHICGMWILATDPSLSGLGSCPFSTKQLRTAWIQVYWTPQSLEVLELQNLKLATVENTDLGKKKKEKVSDP